MWHNCGDIGGVEVLLFLPRGAGTLSRVPRGIWRVQNHWQGSPGLLLTRVDSSFSGPCPLSYAELLPLSVYEEGLVGGRLEKLKLCEILGDSVGRNSSALKGF
jgi:hypothetical protein